MNKTKNNLIEKDFYGTYYSTVEYMERNATRLKREEAWNERERIKEMLRDKPNYMDEVKFSTEIDGTVVEDTGVVQKVNTTKNVIRYLVNSVNNGSIVVFFENKKYPLDKIEVTVYHPDNYNSY